MAMFLRGGKFCFSVVEATSCSGSFTTCMGAHFPAVELDNAIRFSILSRVSGFMRHSPNWPAGLVVSFSIHQRVERFEGLEVSM